jgi:phosphomannomutase/phosphoglucomutase
MSIFKAYDIRGIYGDDLTDDVMFDIGKALGTFLGGNKTVCVGYDTRKSSKKLFEAFSSGLISTGCNVVSLGLVTNPMLYFYAWKNKMFGALITASHNPKQWNGLKLVRPTGVSFIEEIKKIEEIYDSDEFLKGKGKTTNADAIVDYEEFLRKNIGINRKKVVVECFGAAGTVALPLLKRLGLEVISLHDKPDADFFGFERPEPKGDNLDTFKKTVKKEKADFGVAFDGDADRSVFVDDKGRESNVSSVIAVFAEYILRKRKGSILLTADCASEIETIVKNLGGKTIWWRVGHGFIEEKCLKEKALFGGEQSSHLYFNEFYPFSDGTLATVYLAKILNETGKTFSELIDKIKIHPIEKIYINVGNDENKIRIIEAIKKRYPNALDIMDGIKIKLNDIEWVLIRMSQTNPEINLCIEAKDEIRMKDLIAEYTKLIKQV